jgi:oligopeptide transport system substrate-binding protein
LQLPSSQFAIALTLIIATATVTFTVEASEVRRGLGPEPDSIHIHRAQGLAAINLLRDLREGLLTYSIDGEPAPGGSDRWDVSSDGLTYTFHLREDAKWSNGDPVIAEDYVRAWRRALTPATAGATSSLLSVVLNAKSVMSGSALPESLGIRALTPHQLEVQLETHAPWFLEILAHPVSYPLHAELIDEPRNSAVNGAYVLREWTPHAVLRLERNGLFHDAANVMVTTVSYAPVEEPSAELSRYRAGELDITETIPSGRYGWLKENLPNDLRVHPYLGSFWLGLNLAKDTLQSSDLRKALSLAIDRETLARVVLGSGELPAWSIVPPGLGGYEQIASPYQSLSQLERIAEAQRLYRQSGHSAGNPVMLEIRYNTSSLHRRVVVAVSAMWKQVLGVNTELINEEWKVFVNNRRMGVLTEVFRGGWIADFGDPTSFLDLFISGNELNNTFYGNAGYDRLLEEASALREAERMRKLESAELLLMNEMPVIPLYYYVSRHLVSPDIGGFVDNVRDIHLSRYLEVKSEVR